MPLQAIRHTRQGRAGRLILTVQNHAGQWNEQREQGDGHPTEPTESLAELFAGVRRANRKMIGVRNLVHGRGRSVAADRAPGGGKGRWIKLLETS